MSVLDTGGDAPVAQAFEVFSGKVYPVAGARFRTSGLATAETPAQRLARLQQEIAELEQDLSTAASNTEEGGPGFMEMVSNLKSRLEAQTGLAASAKNQEELTRSIQQHLQDWESKKKKEAPKSDSEAGVVYELYGGVGMPAASSAPSWEERLLQVESIVGASPAAAKNQSLLMRLQEMEIFLKRLDPKALEQASAKAKVIRSDLEAASKARNKLASAANFRKEDAKTISSLYDQMVQLEGLSDHLPALVARLQQLASLHAQSSSFSMRVTQSEKEITQLQNVLKQVEDTVTKVETNVVENVKIVEKNMQQLDERMKKL
jgi:chromosome segregation ATPase